MLPIYLQGLSLGLAYTAPIGMQNLFVIHSALPAGGGPYFITGFASASFLWFNGLALTVSLLGSRISSTVLTRICGAVIVLYGCGLLWNLVQLL